MNMNVENCIGEKKIISLRLNVSLVEEVNKIADTLSISMADFIRKAIEKEVEEINNDFFFRLSQVEYCSEEESNNIIKELKELKEMKEEDLKKTKRKIISLKKNNRGYYKCQ